MSQPSIIYQNGKFWVAKTEKAYEVYQDVRTASVKVVTIGLGLPNALGRATMECDRRHTMTQVEENLGLPYEY